MRDHTHAQTHTHTHTCTCTYARAPGVMNNQKSICLHLSGQLARQQAPLFVRMQNFCHLLGNKNRKFPCKPRQATTSFQRPAQVSVIRNKSRQAKVCSLHASIDMHIWPRTRIDSQSQGGMRAHFLFQIPPCLRASASLPSNPASPCTPPIFPHNFKRVPTDHHVYTGPGVKGIR